MNIEQIKSEIAGKLRRVQEDSKELANTQNYDELQKITTKSIVAVADCKTATDIENFEAYLESIEFYYNSCLEEKFEDHSYKELFDFNFELEEEEENKAKELEERKIESIKKAAVAEIESYYSLTLQKCSTFSQKRSLKSLRESAVNSVSQALIEADCINAQIDFKTRVKSFTADIEKGNAYIQAKKQYDEKSIKKNSKNFNIFRMILAFGGLFGGAVYGFLLDWTRVPEWPIAIMCFGAGCLFLCVVYVMADGKKKPSAKRRLAFIRLILAGIFLVFAIVADLVFGKYIGIIPALFATSQFTVGGVVAYLIYRLRIELSVRKILGKKQ